MAQIVGARLLLVAQPDFTDDIKIRLVGLSDTTIGLDQKEEILTYQASDETLEIAAGTGNGKSGTLHALFLHCFGSLPRPLSALRP